MSSLREVLPFCYIYVSLCRVAIDTQLSKTVRTDIYKDYEETNVYPDGYVPIRRFSLRPVAQGRCNIYSQTRARLRGNQRGRW